MNEVALRKVTRELAAIDEERPVTLSSQQHCGGSARAAGSDDYRVIHGQSLADSADRLVSSGWMADVHMRWLGEPLTKAGNPTHLGGVRPCRADARDAKRFASL